MRRAAAELGCSKSHLNEVELGTAHPSTRFVEKASNLLGQDLSGGHVDLERGHPRLRSAEHRLEAFFGPVPGRSIPGGPLRQNFTECRWYPQGAALVDRLDGWRRPGLFWKGIKYLARQQNGVEQGAMLQMLLPDGDLCEVHPHRLGLPNPVVQSLGHWWLNVVVRWESRILLAVPQLILCPRPGLVRRLDFLIAVADGTSVGHGNLEVDGPQHRGRVDRVRDAEIAFPTKRVKATDVWRSTFRRDLLKWAEALLET